MRVHVDRLDPLSIDRDGQFLALTLLAMRAPQRAAPAKHNAGHRRSGARLQKLTARGPDGSFQVVPPSSFFAGRSSARASRVVLPISAFHSRRILDPDQRAS
jgi:hypothetical protein